MNLLLDLGNSRLKWATTEGGALHPGPTLAWEAPDFDAALDAHWHGVPEPRHILAANVTTGLRQQRVAQALHARFRQTPTWLRSPASRAGVRNAYAQPETLGIDRFLSLLAANAAGRAPCVIVGCGSALTMDALAGDGRHLGGLIAAGIHAMRQGLQTAVPGLPVVVDGDLLELACDTGNAVFSGAWQAAAGAIERFYRHAAIHLGGQPQLLLGGGDALPLVRLLGPPAQVFDAAVLRGMQVWMQD